MKSKFLISSIIALSGVTFISCYSSDRYIINEGGIKEAISLEETLGSTLLESNPNGALPWKFLPVDSNFVFTNPTKFKRGTYESIPMSLRTYSDSLGNEILIYEWDLVTSDMPEEKKEDLRMAFEEQHEVYVSKYNSLLEEISGKLGPAEKVGKNISKLNMEVYKSWSTISKWKTDNQVVELRLLLTPKKMYRVILKNLIYKK